MPGTSWSEGGEEPQKSWVLLLRRGAEAGQPKPNTGPLHTGPHVCTFTQLCVCVCVLGVGTVCVPWVCSAGALDGSCCDLAGGGGGLAGMWVRNSRGKEATWPRATSTAPQAPPAVGCPAPSPVQDLGEGSQNTLVPSSPLRTFGKIKFIATDLLIKKTTSPRCLTCKFCETFKEEIVQILYKRFQDKEKEQSFPSLFL